MDVLMETEKHRWFYTFKILCSKYHIVIKFANISISNGHTGNQTMKQNYPEVLPSPILQKLYSIHKDMK